MTNTIAQFQISTEEDLHFQLDFVGLVLAGRALKVNVKLRSTGAVKTELTLANGGLVLVGAGNLTMLFAKSGMGTWPTGEYQADIRDETGGGSIRIMAVRFVYDEPGKLVYGVRGNQATVNWGGNQAVVTAIGGVGPPGPANSLTIDEVVTLETGQPATAEVVGTAPSQGLKLGLPKGDKGDKGDPGEASPAFIAMVQQVEEDAVATAADRVATGQDLVATGLDRVATGLDRVATGQDADATAFDRVQTGLDATATAADRVQTGIDRLAAEAAAGSFIFANKAEAEAGEAENKGMNPLRTKQHVDARIGVTAGKLVALDAAGKLPAVDGSQLTGIPRSFMTPPQGRVTPLTGVAIPGADIAGVTSLFYTPAGGKFAPVLIGGQFTMVDFGELSLPLSAPYHAAATLYDLFIFGSPLKFGSAPANVATEIVEGLEVNSAPLNIRWGSAAGNVTAVPVRQAARVGTFRTTLAGEAQLTSANIDIVNLYNRVAFKKIVTASSATWTYGTADWRAADGGAGPRINFVQVAPGLAVKVTATSFAGPAAGTTIVISAALDGAMSPPLGPAALVSYAGTSVQVPLSMSTPIAPSRGYHYLENVEFASASTVFTGAYTTLTVEMEG